MKKILSFVLVAIIIVGMCGCSAPPQQEDAFLSTDNIKSGGKEIQDVNLCNISVENKQEYIDVVFSFVIGSKLAEGTESSVQGLPEYYVSFCENPTRLVLGIKNLRYWDYQAKGPLIDSTGLVLGSFKILPAGGRDHSQIYINLSSDVTFKVTEADGKLTVSLKKQTTQNTTEYFVYGNLASEYQQGEIDDESGLTPTLSDDLTAVLMISRSFQTQQEAEEFKQKFENDYSVVLGDKSLMIYSTDDGALPQYTDSNIVNELENMILVNRNGNKEGADLFFPDGRLLCMSNDGSKAVFARKEVSENYELETMFLVDASGTATKLIETETTSIAQAIFSPDDNYLFFVEQIEGAMLASVYSFGNKRLITVDEEQLGTFITGASWSDDSSCLYFLAGDELPELKCYDVNDNAISVISNDYFIESELYCANNKLYFNTVHDDEEALVELDLSNSKQNVVTKSDYFVLDKNGVNLLVKRASGTQEGKDILAIYNLESKSEQVIVQDVILGMYFFSADCTKIYYSLDSGEGQFTQSVYCYDIAQGSNKLMFGSVKAKFYCAFDQQELFMQVSYLKNDVQYPATFKVLCD